MKEKKIQITTIADKVRKTENHTGQAVSLLIGYKGEEVARIQITDMGRAKPFVSLTYSK